MKILYLSCHEALAWEECSLFEELGHDVFCPDHFVCDANSGEGNLRPALNKCKDYDELLQEWHTFGRPGLDNKTNMSVDFLKKFDVLICMHLANDWLKPNWQRIKSAKLTTVLRTIGQNAKHNEDQIRTLRADGLKIVRYSPQESSISNYVGGDLFIRFYKDPEMFNNWNGEIEKVLSIGQDLPKRGGPANFNWISRVSEPFQRQMIGSGSEKLDWGQGKVPYIELKKSMRDYRVALSAGVWPASYTLLFQELLMTGTPLVCVGPKLGNPHGWFKDLTDIYEVPHIIKNGVNGFFADDIDEARGYVKMLLNDRELAKTISINGRKTAISLFDKNSIKGQWDEFLKVVCQS